MFGVMLALGIAFGEVALWEQHMKTAAGLEQAGRYKEARAAYRLALEADNGSSSLREGTIRNNLALINRNLGDYQEAQDQYRRALALFENARGSSSPEYASVLHNLAVLDYMQGQLDAASRQFHLALKIRKDTLGENHPATAQTLNSLSAVYAGQGRYAEAEHLCQSAMSIEEKALGPEHPQLAYTLDNLASIYRMQGQFETALDLSRKAHRITQKAYGDRHPTTCLRESKVAVHYANLGRFPEAEETLRRILDVQLQASGEDHPDVATTLFNLAAVCFHRKLPEESEALYRRALLIFERSGASDATLGAGLSNYAWLLRQNGKTSEAEKQEAQARTIVARRDTSRRFTVDVNDLISPRSNQLKPDAWVSINDEGNRLREQGACREAVPVLLRARSAASKELGPNHPSTAIPTNNLAAAYLCLREFTRAEQYFREALALLNDGQSEMKAGILNNLGVLLMRLSRVKEADEVLRQALALSEQVHGVHHPSTAIAVTSLGVLRLHAGDYIQARELFHRSLAIWQDTLGDHLDTATAFNNLGVVSLYLREYEQARDLTSRALDLRRRLLPARHPDVALSLYNHAVALEKLGRRKPARRAFAEAASIRSSFVSDNMLGLTVDLKALERR